MLAKTIRVSYTLDSRSGFYQPLLPLQIFSRGGKSVQEAALLDTGAPFSVLPRSIGENLGLNWKDARQFVKLGGGLSGAQTKAVVLKTIALSFEPLDVAFAWAENDGPRLILGQINFFQNFRICFFRKDSAFSIRPEREALPS